MQGDADVIVVGSGPSGVSVASPMVAAGMKVLLVDGGAKPPADQQPVGAYHDLRRTDPRQWRYFLGAELEALRPAGAPSPKLEPPLSRFAVAGFAASQRIRADGFTVVGSLARGGLSNIWGAGLATYDDDDLEEFPFAAAQLADSYRRVTRRMGVTGFGEDALATAVDATVPSQPELPLAGSIAGLLSRYERRPERLSALGLRLGRARNAVLTQPAGNRRACELCDMCLWGCRLGSVWTASYELTALSAGANFEYRPGYLADSVKRLAGGYRIEGLCRGPGERSERFAFESPLLVLAAGTFTTTRLVLELQGRLEEAVRLLSTPAAAFVLCVPGRLGEGIPTRGFSLAQLSFMAAEPGTVRGASAYGNLFTASGLPAAPVIERIPLSRPTAIKLYRRLQPALVLANCFLPSSYSDNRVRLERRDGGPPWLMVTGARSPSLERRLRALARQLASGFRRLGAILLPTSFTPAGPGEDLRYGGTLPMRASPAFGEVDRLGELCESPGLHVADLSCFPSLPARPPVLSLMANADRIGRELADRWRRERG